jgi:hypothetical protein
VPVEGPSEPALASAFEASSEPAARSSGQPVDASMAADSADERLSSPSRRRSLWIAAAIAAIGVGGLVVALGVGRGPTPGADGAARGGESSSAMEIAAPAPSAPAEGTAQAPSTETTSGEPLVAGPPVAAEGPPAVPANPTGVRTAGKQPRGKATAAATSAPTSTTTKTKRNWGY